jgi:RNA polymerase sigma factor (sigma-70 family)
MKAFENFNPEFPNRFSTFVKLYVRGEIARLWHEQNIVDKGDFSDGEPVVSVSLNESTEDESAAMPGDRDHHSFLLKLLRESAGILDARELRVLTLIYNEDPMSQADVARTLKITRERVRQIHDAAVAKLGRELRRKMNENGVNQ